MTAVAALHGRRILVVEDDYHVAHSLALALEADGAEIVGPAGTVKAALELIARGGRIDGAVLDINLHGEMVYPVADALHQQGVPFVFTTGYDARTVGQRYPDVACLEKPVMIPQLIDALFG